MKQAVTSQNSLQQAETKWNDLQTAGNNLEQPETNRNKLEQPETAWNNRNITTSCMFLVQQQQWTKNWINGWKAATGISATPPRLLRIAYVHAYDGLLLCNVLYMYVLRNCCGDSSTPCQGDGSLQSIGSDDLDLLSVGQTVVDWATAVDDTDRWLYIVGGNEGLL